MTNPTARRYEVRDFTKVGCFEIGSRVFRGNGAKALTITALRSENGRDAQAKLGTGCWYRLGELSLSGPNGKGA